MDPSTQLISAEYVVAHRPLTVHRTVRWAECDPAGVVYAGNFAEYLLATGHLFHQVSLGRPIGRRDNSQEYITPGKALSLVFHNPLWPGDVFDMAVYLGEVGSCTTDILVHGYRHENGEDVFVGRLTLIYVSETDRHRAVSVPDDVRDLFERYRAETPPPPEVLTQVTR